MTRNNPKTSNAAYRQITPDMLKSHWGKILRTLNDLGKANAETISIAARMKDQQVARRMSELERNDFVYKPGTVSKTTSNRDAFDYGIGERIITRV